MIHLPEISAASGVKLPPAGTDLFRWEGVFIFRQIPLWKMQSFCIKGEIYKKNFEKKKKYFKNSIDKTVWRIYNKLTNKTERQKNFHRVQRR